MVMGVVRIFILLFLARVLVTYFLARLWEIKEDEEPRYRKVSYIFKWIISVT